MTGMRNDIDTDEDTNTRGAAAVVPLFTQLASFGFIGACAFFVDLIVYNALRAGVLQDSPIWCKVLSVAVATVAAWLGNRYLTFRRERSPRALREA
ncbi:GtrA family protein [Microbacterium rhizomatis]|uniref:GtrA family protein n=1 Tax=Microbacterium rhizomatis TaxID=1631477 RepID=UPI001FEB6A71|nr:GtrA family protein [Microbacterium rhizomatis]